MALVIREERRIKQYSSLHQILLVGEGDFSFSLSLANAFQSATNIVATSLDTYEELVTKYRSAENNLAVLQMYGATLFYGVDVTKMCSYPDLRWRKFHRIIYNFPHAGFHRKEDDPYLIKMHCDLVSGFFRNARLMLHLEGEVHVTHKMNDPYNKWDIQKLGEECSLQLVAHDDKFRSIDFPGYCNKRGAGLRCDETFKLGVCKTFRFRIALPVQQLTVPPLDIKPPLHLSTVNDVVNMSNGITPLSNTRDDCRRIFGGYLKHVDDTFGVSSSLNDVIQSVHNALSHGYQAYVSSSPTRPLSGYINILEELHRESISRTERLKQMLSSLDMYV